MDVLGKKNLLLKPSRNQMLKVI